MKKAISAILATALTVMGLGISGLSLASAPAIESTEYKGSGRVEVEFTRDVDYKNAKVTVKDSDGKSYSASITGKDDDELKFKVSNIAAGKSYTYTISGVRREGTSSYGSVSGKFSVKSASSGSTSSAVKIDEVDYDSKGYVEVEFAGKVKYNNVKVTVKGADGKTYSATVRSKSSGELKFRVPSIVEGRSKKYTFTISGVALKSGDSYTSVSGSFYAYDD